MNEIEFPLSHTTVAEACYLAVDSSKIIKKHGVQDEYLDRLGDTLEAQEKLAKADNKRDGAFLALKLFIEGYLKWNTEKYTTAAEKMWDVLKRHGLNLNREPYEEESGLLESLFIELDKPAMVEAVTTLKQTELITFLKDSQKEFREIYYKSVKTEAGKEIIIAATTLKKAAYSTLKKTIGYLNSIVLAKPDIYKGVHGEMAKLINNLNQKIRKRRRKK